MEKLAASRSSNAKVIGSIISIAGAFVLTFYKGPSIMNSSSLHQSIGFLKSVDSSWVIAGILLTVEYLLFSLWYILMVGFVEYFVHILNINSHIAKCGALLDTIFVHIVLPIVSTSATIQKLYFCIVVEVDTFLLMNYGLMLQHTHIVLRVKLQQYLRTKPWDTIFPAPSSCPNNN